MSDDILNREIRYIKGVGEKRAAVFRRLQVKTIADLLTFYPRAYEDRRKICKITELVPGEFCSFDAFVITEVKSVRIRANLTITKLRASDESGSIGITFFNQPYVKDTLIPGRRYLFYGKIAAEFQGFEVNTPEYTALGDDEEIVGTIEPIYSLSAGLGRKNVMAAIESAIDIAKDHLKDAIPTHIIKTYGLANFEQAIKDIHRPPSEEELDAARKRLVFEELFTLTAGLFMLKGRRTHLSGDKYELFPMEEFLNVLPFELTGAQHRAIGDALEDISSGRLANRLIQGDVGSGKTVVAAAVAYQIIKNGAQAALMAPTEVLAVQHERTLSALFENFGVKTVLLLGKMTQKQRREALAALESGEAGLAVGTHAVISDSVSFKNLGLVICDEQQRFGVEQRAKLSAKGKNPHMLIMSATPIPRTLGLIMYGDLDLTIIDELPPGRMSVDTFIVGQDMRQRIEAFVRKQVSNKNQVYIVCPLIDENDGDEVKSVTEYAETQSEIYGDLRVATLHGRMKSSEKEAIMASFASGQVDILISTTVIEVGVDNPNATLMVVENAERFGLSQLHQLRGRVGRGKQKSYCVLFSSGGEKSAERLKILAETSDGFKIAERDLEIRGPGNFFGNRQHGLPSLKLASLSDDMELLRAAQNAAEELISLDPELEAEENRELAKRIMSMLDTKDGNVFN